jgi:hypothetical protein
MPVETRRRTSGLTLAIAAATVVSIVLFAVLTATPTESTSVGGGATSVLLRVLLGGVGGIALAVVLLHVIGRMTRRS